MLITDQSRPLQLMQHRIQRARPHVIPMVLQFFHQLHAADGFLRRVVKNVQPDEAQVEMPQNAVEHRNRITDIEVRYHDS